MQIAQIGWSAESGWEPVPGFSAIADLVLVFADEVYFQTEACYTELSSLFPQAHIVGCSSSGNVLGVGISDGNIVATAVKLAHSSIRLKSIDMRPGENVQQLGARLMEELAAPDLRHAFILSDGLQVNGSELAKGLNQAGIAVTGGMAGDGTRFGQTWCNVPQ